MLRFLVRRLLTAIPTLFLVVTVAFFMMRAAPGNPFDGQRRLSPEVERNVMAKYGLNKPLGEQYLAYVGGVLHGDFGPSLKYKNKTVIKLIAQGFPASLMIGGLAMVLATAGGVFLGVIAALRRNRSADYAVMTFAILGICIPTFVTAPLLVLILASRLGLLPTAGWPIGGQSLFDSASYLVLPIGVLSLPEMAVISRLTLAGLIEARSANDVRTARVFVASIAQRKIVAIHEGVVRDFAEVPDGMSPLGIRINAAHDLLWVAASTLPQSNHGSGDLGNAALLAFDITSGALRARYPVPIYAPKRSLSDLAFAPDGTAYVSDAIEGSIFRLRPGADALEVVGTPKRFSSPQGMVGSADGRFLLVADYSAGL